MRHVKYSSKVFMLIKKHFYSLENDLGQVETWCLFIAYFCLKIDLQEITYQFQLSLKSYWSVLI